MLELSYIDTISFIGLIPTSYVIEIKKSVCCLSGIYALFAQAANISNTCRVWYGKLTRPCRQGSS